MHYQAFEPEQELKALVKCHLTIEDPGNEKMEI